MRPSAFAALALVGLTSTPAYAAATITIQNVDGAGEGFNDPTPASPVGSNPGTTLGQQRLFAFQAAANIWGASIDSAPVILISAQFSPLPCSANSAVLGSAGATNVTRDFPNAPLVSTWYPVALANSLAGSDLNGGTAEIGANFNSNLGNAGCLTGIPFYLGVDNNAPANSVDLVTVLLHEFGHGLGFATFVDGTNGSELGGFGDAFEEHLFDNSTGKFWRQMTAGERATSALNTRKVAWDGNHVEAAVSTFLDLGQPLLNVTAPVAREMFVGTATFGPALVGPISAPVVLGLDGGGSSLGCNAIVTSLTGKIALLDAGTCSSASKVKRAQTAGAIAVLVANDFAGSVLHPLSGSDGTITIPSAPITFNDGAFLKANASGLTAILQSDATRRRGADASARPLTYNPSPFEGGSSDSHWDTTASPNTLMEPALNSDLGHDLDLTLPAFRDLGWNGASGPLPTLSVNDVAVSEGNSGTSNAVFTVSLSAASGDPVTVQYATAPGTATAGTDYTTLALTTLTFDPGETSKPVTVKVKGDTKDENNETFFLDLSNPTNATLADAQGLGTITDNDPLPALSMANVSTAEGSTNKMVTLTVKLTPASGRTVTVNYATANGTATLANNDYLAASGTLTFDPGQTSKTFKVTVKGDTTLEPDESFSVGLSGATNATLPPAATVTLTNDDAAPVPVSASINNVTLAEGDSGTTNAVFTVTLSAAPTGSVSLAYATADGTALTPGDYATKSGTLTFTAGQTSKTISVPVKGDKAQEANETFFVNLSSPVGLTISDNQGLGTITNNDAPKITILDKSVTEGNSGTKSLSFTLTLSGAALNTVTVQCQTVAGTATAGVDYTETSGTVTFTAGQTSRTFAVPVKGDTLDENDETFLVNLSAPTNATIVDGQATGTIIDNE